MDTWKRDNILARVNDNIAGYVCMYVCVKILNIIVISIILFKIKEYSSCSENFHLRDSVDKRTYQAISV